MEFRQALEQAEQSQVFKNWRQKHPEAFLAHAFCQEGEWQIGFLDKETMGVFMIGENETIVKETNEILKTGQEILPLDLTGVKAGSDTALQSALEIARKSYPGETALKTFFIIQQTPSGAIFNVTFFTKGFKTINIKMSAKDCSLVKHSIDKLFDFG